MIEISLQRRFTKASNIFQNKISRSVAEFTNAPGWEPRRRKFNSIAQATYSTYCDVSSRFQQVIYKPGMLVILIKNTYLIQ